MIQGREDVRLALKPRQTLGIAGNGRREDFERDLALQPRIPRPIHLAHATGAERCNDFVGADTRPGGEGHRRAAVSYVSLTCFPGTSRFSSSPIPLPRCRRPVAVLLLPQR